MTDGNDNAYPVAIGGNTRNGQDDYVTDGLTKREYFAAMILQGLLVSQSTNTYQDREYAIMDTINIADKLIEQLNKRGH